MARHRHLSQVEQVVHWLAQARASTGRYRPTLSVGRDGGLCAPTTSGMARRLHGDGVGLGPQGQASRHSVSRPHARSSQGTWTAQLNALLHDILCQVDSHGLRLVSMTDDGYHPSDYDHSVLQQMPDPRRPWRQLEWIRMIDYDHACQYVQQLAEVIFGPGTESQGWARRMREQLKTRTNGVARVLQSAPALRHHRGLWGQAKVYAQTYAYLHKRSRWMHYQSYRR